VVFMALQHYPPGFGSRYHLPFRRLDPLQALTLFVIF
jgi:hypothetical protein